VAWQYAQLTVTHDSRSTAGLDLVRTVIWQQPGQDNGENFSDSEHTILQLLNRFGADGWELVAVQEHHEGQPGGRNWDSPWSQVTYTFKQQLA